MFPQTERSLLDVNLNDNDDRKLAENNLIISFGNILSLKSPYTMEHSSRVKSLALELALQIGFQTDKLRSLESAALLHDIGKIVISDYVTDKPTRLTEVESLMMKQHTLLGYRIIQPLQLDPLINNVVLYHHESYDGSGYLAGLRGNEIPLEARIVKIADYYEALVSARPYRAAYSSSQAVELLKEERRIFDPFLFEKFLEMIDNITPTPKPNIELTCNKPTF